MNSTIRTNSAALLATLLLSITLPSAHAQVKCGADLLLTEQFDLIRGKRIGLITNATGVLAGGETTADALFLQSETKLVALFGPEHGIRGREPAGKQLESGKDSKTGLPVYSLYGSVSKPTDKMLNGIDVLVYDIQDVGARFYTFESTLALAMEAAAEHDIPFIVLDRPNPIRGVSTEGYIRLDSLRSFVAMSPTPITHGMTVGELAGMINGEGWLRNGMKARLTVVRMEGWKREMWYDQTGLVWVNPSPNIVSLGTAIVYPGTCFLEGTNLSEGRGTDRPFEYVGAPYVDGKIWADTLNQEQIPGVRFEAVTFTPRSIPGVVDKPKFEGVSCNGIRIVVTNRDEFAPVECGVRILASARNLFSRDFKWNGRWVDRLAGSPKLRTSIDANLPANEITKEWSQEVGRFKVLRAKYLLYE